MSIVPFPRRVLVLCAATVFLHLAVISWLGSHIEPVRARAPRLTPPVLVAHLRAPEPTRPLPAPRPRPAPKPAQAVPKLKPVPLPAPLNLDEPVAETPVDVLPAIAAAASGPELPPMQAGAPAKTPAVQSVPGQEPVPTVPPAATPQEAAAPSGPRRFRASVPPSAELGLVVARRDADGTERSGVGSMVWRVNGHAYQLQVDAGVSLLVTRVNLLTTTSAGEIDEAGIAPVRFTEKRFSRALTATHFLREEGKISFSASERNFPLQPGAQDKATLPFQLAAIARADPAQLSGDIDIQVGEDKDATVYRFVSAGQEELDTPLGKLATWHLVRPPKPGSYNARLEVWLAPERDWYPVQIRNTEASGAVTTQSVSKIVQLER
ncbi:MAG TPA: DUF3108 domain-containing protein [Telluria sp.]|nr:DUF3108 domain-containing protein [Telluria sp.]